MNQEEITFTVANRPPQNIAINGRVKDARLLRAQDMAFWTRSPHNYGRSCFIFPINVGPCPPARITQTEKETLTQRF